MSDKYKLTDKTKEASSIKLFRIQALRSFGDVKAGDLGGWVEGVKNLSQDGDAWVSGNAWVFGNARVYGDAQVYGKAWVFGNAWVNGDAQVFGDARVYGNAQVSGNAQVHGKAWVHSNAQVFGDANLEKTPIYTQGRRYWIGYCGEPGYIRSGCEYHTISWWLENVEDCAKENGYTETEQREYRLHVCHIVAWMRLYGLDK